LQKIIIFGNSGAGKSTLAKRLAVDKKLAHLDLDTLAWQVTSPPQRKTIKASLLDINHFTQTNASWIIEGCYGDLLELLVHCKKDTLNESSTAVANEIIFLDLPVANCIVNATNRPWEPHKYSSKQAQDDNLAMLIDWIKAYETRSDTFSKQAHQQLYECFDGKKTRITSNN
jgi:adenylate kinase family enzyme